MNNKIIVLGIFCFAQFSTSCKKENPGDKIIEPSNESNCRIRSIKFQGLESYVYDSLGRIISYSGNTLTYSIEKVKISVENSRWTSTSIEITLDSNKNASSRKYLKHSGIGENFEIKTISNGYFYNQDQNLVKEFITSQTEISDWPYIKDTLNEVFFYDYQNGDLTKVEYSNSKGDRKTINYSYTNLPNQLGELEQKLNFKGKPSKHLINSKEEITNSSPAILYQYEYTFDSNGKLLTETINEGLMVTSRRYFSWECEK